MLRRANPKAWRDVVKLMKGQAELWARVEQMYPELKGDEDAMAEEVISHYSGARGAKRLMDEIRAIGADSSLTLTEKASAISALGKVKQAIEKFWHGVADLLHIRFTTADEVADRVLADLLHGVNPNEVNAEETQQQVFDTIVKQIGDKGIEVHLATDEELEEVMADDAQTEDAVDAEMNGEETKNGALPPHAHQAKSSITKLDSKTPSAKVEINSHNEARIKLNLIELEDKINKGAMSAENFLNSLQNAMTTFREGKPSGYNTKNINGQSIVYSGITKLVMAITMLMKS